MALFGPKLDWLSRAFSSFFGPVERSRTYSAQLLLREGNDVLLGEHTKAGLFPGRLSGLIADSYKPGQDAGLEALAAAAKNYGIDLDLTRCRAVGRMEFVEADAPHEVSDQSFESRRSIAGCLFSAFFALDSPNGVLPAIS
eukprot:TRINITY_DN30758_c0_g1_i1.p1 TRINITY_DN30758_c0_g1~~TRINITY_DN30758_c0_g1_i1.p1  ORF type:complete len:141 (-),score=19.75 TRINITY_DN30758_c0_g1_i1:14-436(-)